MWGALLVAVPGCLSTRAQLARWLRTNTDQRIRRCTTLLLTLCGWRSLGEGYEHGRSEGLGWTRIESGSLRAPRVSQATFCCKSRRPSSVILRLSGARLAHGWRPSGERGARLSPDRNYFLHDTDTALRGLPFRLRWRTRTLRARNTRILALACAHNNRSAQLVPMCFGSALFEVACRDPWRLASGR